MLVTFIILLFIRNFMLKIITVYMTQCTFITIHIVSDFSDVSAECQKRSALQRYEPVLLGLTYS